MRRNRSGRTGRFLRSATRVLALLTCSLVCAGVAGLLALRAHVESLPPSDGAYGITVSETLRDPLVLSVWQMLVLAGAAGGFVCSLWLLWRVDLLKAIPVVVAATVAAAYLSALIAPPLSAFVAMFVGVAVMYWFRQRATRDRERPRHREGALQGPG